MINETVYNEATAIMARHYAKKIAALGIVSTPDQLKAEVKRTFDENWDQVKVEIAAVYAKSMQLLEQAA